MKRALIGLAALPLFTTAAYAADTLATAQLDQVTAGDAPALQLPPGATPCVGCSLSSSTSNSVNGSTTSSSTTTVVGVGGGGGGGGGGSGGGGNTGGGPSGPGVAGQTVTIPAGAAAVLNNITSTIIFQP